MTKRVVLKAFLLFLSASTIGSAQTIPNYVASSGLVGWWPFNGDGNDMTTNNNHATVYGAVLTADRHGTANSAYMCNAGFLQSPTTTGIPQGGAMSIALWINPTSNYNISEIICLGGPYDTYWGAVGGNNAFTLNYGRGCGSTGSSLQSIPNDYNQWHHMVLVSTGTGGTARVYYDGVYVGTSTTASTGGSCSTANLYFGKDAYFSSNYPGSIDDIGIWNRALSDCEIWDLYTETAGSGFSTQPISQTSGPGNSVQFSAAAANPGSSYQWQTNTGAGFYNLSNGGQYSGVTTAYLSVSNTTMSNNHQQFRCTITSSTCTAVSNTATLTIENAVGILEYSSGHLFSVHPNPCSDQLNLKADKALVGASYTLYDYTGKAIIRGSIREENTLIETADLAAGLYLLSLDENTGNGIRIVKR